MSARRPWTALGSCQQVKTTRIDAGSRAASRARLAVCLALLLGAVLLVAIPTSGSRAAGSVRSDLVTITHYGLWTMQELGYRDEVRHHTQADLARKPIYQALPAGAS